MFPELIFREVCSALPTSLSLEIFIPFLTILTLGTFVVIASVQRLLRRKETKCVYRDPPTMTGLPVIGWAHHFMKLSWPIKNMSPIVYTYYGAMGVCLHFDQDDVGIQGVSYATQRLVSLFKPETVQALLTSNHFIEKSHFYDFLKPWLGNGLLLNKGDSWRRSRKMLTSAFHFKILDAFQSVMYEKSKTLVSVLEENGPDFQSIKNPIDLYTVDVISCTAMGIEMNGQRDENNPYVQSFKKIGLLLMKRMINPLHWPDFIYKWTKPGKEFYMHLKTINDNVTKIIQERKEKLEKERFLENFNLDNFKGKVAFLDMVILQHLSDKSSFTEENIRDEINTFMFAGQDTTASGLAWCLFLLGNYPKEQELLYDEVVSILGDDLSEDITVSHLKSMTYLDCVLKESQRLLPSVPFIARQISEDMDINGYLIKKNTTLMVQNYALHRNPKIYPDPEKFQPTRFTPENSKGRHPFAFVPFAAGPRNCIGQRFALSEEKTVVANIIRHFKIVSKDHLDKIPICPEIVSRPAIDIKIKFIPRKSH